MYPVDAQLTDLVISALVETLRVEHRPHEAGIAMMREVLIENVSVTWQSTNIRYNYLIETSRVV